MVKCENTVFFAMSKKKGSAACDHAVLQDIMSILRHGKLHSESKGEAFMNATRLPGGRRKENDPLPDGLVEWCGPHKPLFPNAKA